MIKFTLEYTQSGKAISDFLVQAEASKIANIINGLKPGVQFEVVKPYSTSNIFTAIREKIACGELDPTTICFRYNEQDIVINKYGAIPEWPEGFCDIESTMAESIIRHAMEKRKKEKGETTE